MSPADRDHAASAHARLHELARRDGVELELLLVRYANERLLRRLGASEAAERFVLKGATRLMVEGAGPYRPTRDIDLLGIGSSSPSDLQAVFRSLCAEEAVEEGLRFEADSVRVEEIRDRAEYGGVRVRLQASLGGARIRMQVDIGFGDAVVPRPEWRELESLLGHPRPRVRVYPLEAVVAEKLQILLEFGAVNSRLKDYFDLDHLARTGSFVGAPLARAVRATLERRETPVPPGVPEGIRDEFARERGRPRAWREFALRAGRDEAQVDPLDEVVDRLRRFLMPVLAATPDPDAWRQRWRPGGPWERDESAGARSPG